MKQAMVLLMCLVFTGSKSQSDSTHGMRFSGIQVDILGLTTFNGLSFTKQDIMKFVSDDPLLNKDMNGYSSWTNGSGSVDYNGSFGFKLFTTLNKKRKHEVDLFLGFYFGGGTVSSMNYFKQTFDTTNTFYGSGGKKLYEVRQTDSSYNFNISSDQFVIPMGITVNTNKQKRFWASYGLSIAPGLRTNYRFTSNEMLSTSSSIASPDALGNYYGSGPSNYSSELLTSSSRKLKQNGFNAYACIPLTLNMRISKKVAFLKHLNASVSISPGYYVTYDKISKLNQSFALVSNFGFRYNL